MNFIRNGGNNNGESYIDKIWRNDYKKRKS